MKDFLANKYLQIILRLIIGGLFIYASYDKLFNPAEFADIVKGYQILPLGLVNIFGIVLPYVEFIAGTFLVFGVFKKGSALTISVLLIVFLLALIRAQILGLDINCGCFSLETNGEKSNIPMRILEDILMLAGSLIIYFFSDSRKKAGTTAESELKQEGEIQNV